jgi:hypothetical protein
MELISEITLPYLLDIPDGAYPTSPRGESIHILSRRESDDDGPFTVLKVEELIAEALTPEAEQRRWTVLDNQLLRRTNRLLRAYRVGARDSSISELSTLQASPFTHTVRLESGEVQPFGRLVLVSATPARSLRAGRRDALLRRLASGQEPAVAELFLQDAAFALQQGRFREAVLFAWATIDSEFSAVYHKLIGARLGDDYSEGRKQLLGLDVSLRTKMTVILNLLAGLSLFKTGSHGDWDRLSTSYGKRNGIIHRGEVADQEDAQNAVTAARWVMSQIAALESAPANQESIGHVESESS